MGRVFDMVVADLMAAFCVAVLAVHLASVVAAAIRCRRRPLRLPPPKPPLPVTLVLPVCGIENFTVETLGAAFRLDYPDYEIVFCAARCDDPAAPLVRRLIAQHPHVPARLLIGDERVSGNPKLDNVIKGWHAACHPWIVIADSNLLMPVDYIQRLLARWRAGSGAVCSMPIGTNPGNFWAELEIAFPNTLQARYQYAAESAGLGFAQGKTMLFRREMLDAHGGIGALAAETAEDAAATKLIRAAGLHVHLVDNPFAQPLGRRRFREVWARQLRWARLRRISFPALFLPEIFVGSLLPGIAAMIAAAGWGQNGAAAACLLLAIWFGAEIALACRTGWPLTWRLLPALAIRDLLLPALWIAAWTGNDFVWRGNAMSARPAVQRDPAAATAAADNRAGQEA